MLITWEKTGARCAAPRLARSGAGNSRKWGLDRSKTRTSGAWDSALARCNACHNLEMIRG